MSSQGSSSLLPSDDGSNRPPSSLSRTSSVHTHRPRVRSIVPTSRAENERGEQIVGVGGSDFRGDVSLLNIRIPPFHTLYFDRYSYGEFFFLYCMTLYWKFKYPSLLRSTHIKACKSFTVLYVRIKLFVRVSIVFSLFFRIIPIGYS